MSLHRIRLRSPERGAWLIDHLVGGASSDGSTSSSSAFAILRLTTGSSSTGAGRDARCLLPLSHFDIQLARDAPSPSPWRTRGTDFRFNFFHRRFPKIELPGNFEWLL